MAKTVQEVLQGKGNQVMTISPDSSVYEAIDLMAGKSIGSLLVTDGDDVAGIISERDYARKVILKGRLSKQTKVREIMTERVLCVTPGRTLEECLALMTERRIRHLPVVDNDKVVGIISTGDVVKAMVAEKEFIIEQLTRYISGY